MAKLPSVPMPDVVPSSVVVTAPVRVAARPAQRAAAKVAPPPPVVEEAPEVPAEVAPAPLELSPEDAFRAKVDAALAARKKAKEPAALAAAPPVVAPISLSPAPTTQGGAAVSPETPPAVLVTPTDVAREPRGRSGLKYASANADLFLAALARQEQEYRKRAREQAPEMPEEQLDEMSYSWKQRHMVLRGDGGAQSVLDAAAKAGGPMGISDKILSIAFPIPKVIPLPGFTGEDPEKRWQRISEGGIVQEEIVADVDIYGRATGRTAQDMPLEQFAGQLKTTEDLGTSGDVVGEMVSVSGFVNGVNALTAETGIKSGYIAAKEKLGVSTPEEAGKERMLLQSGQRNEGLDRIAFLKASLRNDEAGAQFGGLSFNELPQAMSPVLPDVAAFKKAYSERQLEMFQTGGLEAVAAVLDPALKKSDAEILRVLRATPQGALRKFQPTVGLGLEKLDETLKTYDTAKKYAGTETSRFFSEVASSVMFSEAQTDRGVVLRPSATGQILNVMGIPYETAMEARIPLMAAAGALMPGGVVRRVATMAAGAISQELLAGGLSLVGADDAAQKVENALLPNKAGVDYMLASGAYDTSWMGITDYRPLRTEKSNYLDRVFANYQMPEFQGLGMYQAIRRTNVDPNSTLGRVAFGIDTAADLFLDVEGFYAGGLSAVPHAAHTAYSLSKVMPEGYRLQGAMSAGAPKTYSRVRATRKALAEGKGLREVYRAGAKASEEADVLSAVHNVVEDSIRDAINSGKNPFDGKMLSDPLKDEVFNTLKAAGVDPLVVQRKLAEVTDAVTNSLMDNVDLGLRREAVSNRGKRMLDNLRQTPEYRAHVRSLDELVTRGDFTPLEKEAALAFLEAQAHSYAGRIPGTTPQDFFARTEIRTQMGTPPPAAGTPPAPAPAPAPAAGTPPAPAPAPAPAPVPAPVVPAPAVPGTPAPVVPAPAPLVPTPAVPTPAPAATVPAAPPPVSVSPAPPPVVQATPAPRYALPDDIAELVNGGDRTVYDLTTDHGRADSALPERSVLGKTKDGKWQVLALNDADETVVASGVHADPLDAVAEHLDQVMPREDWDTSPTRVGPVLRTMPRLAVEEAIRSAPIEYLVVFAGDGQQVLRSAGDTESVAFDYSDIVLALHNGALDFIHNHPPLTGVERQTSINLHLSPSDVYASVINGLPSIEVVSELGTQKLSSTTGWSSMDDPTVRAQFLDAFDEADKKAEIEGGRAYYATKDKGGTHDQATVAFVFAYSNTATRTLAEDPRSAGVGATFAFQPRVGSDYAGQGRAAQVATEALDSVVSTVGKPASAPVVIVDVPALPVPSVEAVAQAAAATPAPRALTVGEQAAQAATPAPAASPAVAPALFGGMRPAPKLPTSLNERRPKLAVGGHYSPLVSRPSRDVVPRFENGIDKALYLTRKSSYNTSVEARSWLKSIGLTDDEIGPLSYQVVEYVARTAESTTGTSFNVPDMSWRNTRASNEGLVSPTAAAPAAATTFPPLPATLREFYSDAWAPSAPDRQLRRAFMNDLVGGVPTAAGQDFQFQAFRALSEAEKEAQFQAYKSDKIREAEAGEAAFYAEKERLGAMSVAEREAANQVVLAELAAIKKAKQTAGGGTLRSSATVIQAPDIEAAAPGVTVLREAMLKAAGEETAFDPKAYAERKDICKLTGHCNAAAYVVQKKYGGELLSAKVQGETHIWNRLPDGTQVDLTGSQYGGDGFHPVASGGKVVPLRATVNPRFKKFEAEVLKTAAETTALRSSATVVPEFRSLVPAEEGGLEWLQDQIDYAEEKGRNRWGVPHMGKVTGNFSGAVAVPVDVLAQLPGQRAEQANVRPASLDYIRKNWDSVGKEPPYIEVAYNGEAWVSEGNHRILVAAERGEKTLPVEVRYFDGGERVEGPLTPEKIGAGEEAPIVPAAPAPMKLSSSVYVVLKAVEYTGLPSDIYGGLLRALDELPEVSRPGARSYIDGIVEGTMHLDDTADEIVAARILDASGLGDRVSLLEVRNYLGLDRFLGVDDIPTRALQDSLENYGRKVVERAEDAETRTLTFYGKSDAAPDAEVTFSVRDLDDGTRELVIEQSAFANAQVSPTPVIGRVVRWAAEHNIDTVSVLRSGDTTERSVTAAAAYAAGSHAVDVTEGGSRFARIKLDPDMVDSYIARQGQVVLKSSSYQLPGGPLVHVLDMVSDGSFAGFVRENAEVMRALGGDFWTDEFLKNFEHTIDPATNRVTLEPEGERQFQRILEQYLTSKVSSPSLSSKMDKVFAMMQGLYLRARGIHESPTLAMMQLDAVLRPDIPIRNTMARVVSQMIYERRTLYVKDTAAERVGAAERRAVGQRAEFARTKTTRAEASTALRIAKGSSNVNVVDVVANAIAQVTTEHARRKLPTVKLVRVTTRSIVPEERLPILRKTVRDQLVLAGINPKEIAKQVDSNTGNITFTPTQQPKILALVNQMAGTWHGDRLPRDLQGRRFTGDSMSVDAYNFLVELMTDTAAGPGSVRDRMAEAVPKSVGYALFRTINDGAGKNLNVYRDLKGKLLEKFHIEFDGKNHLDPGIVEIVERLKRELEEVNDWMRQAGEIAVKNTPKIWLPQIIQSIRSLLIPPFQVASLPLLIDLNKVFGAEMPYTVTDLLARLTDIEDAYAAFKPAGLDVISDLETSAFGEAHRIKQALATSGLDVSSLPPADLKVLEDVAEILVDGVQRRVQTVSDRAGEIGVALAGMLDAGIMKNFDTFERKAALYSSFFEGRWDDMFDLAVQVGLTGALENFGEFQKKFSQSEALLAMVGRMRAQELMVSFSERLSMYGVGGDMAALTADYPIGSLSGRGSFQNRVEHYIAQIVNFGEMSEVDSTGRKVYEPAPPKGGEDLAAFVKAHELMAQWGFKFGKGEWKIHVLPDGTKMLLPEMVADNLNEAVQRQAGLAGAFRDIERARDPSKENVFDVPLTQRQQKAVEKEAKATKVRTAVGATVGGVAGASIGVPLLGAAAGALVGRDFNRAINVLAETLPVSLTYLKIGITTGIGLPNIPYYVANAFGGFMQALMGVGTAQTVRMLIQNPKFVGAVVAELFGSGKFQVSAKPIVTADGRIFTVKGTAKLAQAEGLSGSFIQAETVRSVADDLRSMEPTFYNKMMKYPSAWQNLLMEFAGSIDNMYRVSAFVDEVRLGKSAAEAAETARKIAFDYSALTDFEKSTMRNIIMFYSYQRRNIDLFFDTLLTNPGRIAAQLRTVNHASQTLLEGEADVVLPEYLRGRLMLTMRDAVQESYDSGRVAVVAPQIPVMDVVTTVLNILSITEDESQKALIGKFTPWAQAPFVLGLGIEPFSGRELGSYDKIPRFLYEGDMLLSGGTLVRGVFGGVWQTNKDPSSNDSDETSGYFQARNAKAYWIWRNLLEFPTAGRSITTLEAMDRADLGFVEGAVGLARSYREGGGSETLDAFFLKTRQGIPSILTDGSTAPPLEDLNSYVPMPQEDLIAPRQGMTHMDEVRSWAGVRSVRIDNPAVALDRIYREEGFDLGREAKQLKRAEAFPTQR